MTDSLAASQVTIVGHFLCFTPVLSLFPPLTIKRVSCWGTAWFRGTPNPLMVGPPWIDASDPMLPTPASRWCGGGTILPGGNPSPPLVRVPGIEASDPLLQSPVTLTHINGETENNLNTIHCVCFSKDVVRMPGVQTLLSGFEQAP